MADVKVPALLHKMSKAAQKAWYKKNKMSMPQERSVAQAKKIKPVESKPAAVATVSDKPKTTREINTERQKAYYAKGGRAPIGAGGSGGHGAMAGAGQSTVRDIKAGIRAGVNPKLSLDPYESEKAKKVGPRSLKLRKEAVEKKEEPPFTPDKKKIRRGSGGEMSHAKWLAKQAMMKKMKAMKEDVEQPIVEQDDSMEKKEMAETQLHFIKYAAEEILEFIKMGGEIEEWYQNKLSKVQSEVESLHSYIEGEKRRTGMVKEEEQIDEKAPPGAKYERMVKHIKKGYAKGGLTPQEKSITYATAWKAYNKANEEVEQLSEGSYLQYSGVIHSNVGNAKHGEEKDEGHHYTLTVPSHRDVGDHLSGKRAYSRVARENPHLEPHHVKAILQSTGNDKEDVEVEHGGKTYKHRLYNNQDPDYIGEEVEQVKEKYMGFKAVMAAAKKGGARDPAAVAAAIGRKKYGKEKFQAAAAAGKKMGEEVEQTDEAVRIVDIEKKGKLPKKQDVRDRLALAARERRKITGGSGVKGFNKPIGFSPTKYMDTSYIRAIKKEEVVTEAEGKVAVTPKEKDLAAHHGDKTRITYGDVIKARLKSVAAKKMGKQ